MNKLLYLPCTSIIEPEIFAYTPRPSENDGRRNMLCGPTADGAHHKTTGFTTEEIGEIADLIRQGKRVRLNASSLCTTVGANGATNAVNVLADATTWKRGTIQFDPMPTEKKYKKSIIIHACIGVAIGVFWLAPKIPPFRTSVSRS